MHLQLKVRDERLGEASELQKFLQNLDHFQQWLTRTETAIASEDIPNDLVEAEQLLHDHALIKQEIDTYAPDYAQMKEYGQKVVEGQEGVQYMFLREVGAVANCRHCMPLVSTYDWKHICCIECKKVWLCHILCTGIFYHTV